MQNSCLVVFYCGYVVLVDFTHILQGHLAGTRAQSYDFPSASEATLNNMGEWIMWTC